MTTVLIIIVVLLAFLALAAFRTRQAVRGRSPVPLRPGGGRPRPGLQLIIPFMTSAAGLATDRHYADPVTGNYHPGQRQRQRLGGRVFRVVDAVKSVVAIENVYSAIDQFAQTTLRKVVGRRSLDQTLSETDKINLDIRAILDVTTVEWGVEVTLVELKDIQLPETMKRAMARPGRSGTGERGEDHQRRGRSRSPLRRSGRPRTR